MRTLLIRLLLTGTVGLLTGCASSAYSGGLPSARFPSERATGEAANSAIRTWSLENRQMIDDIYSALMLDPASRLSKWHVR